MSRPQFSWTRICFTIFSIVLSLPVIGQTLSVSGTVLKVGTIEALPFVTIAIKNSSRGTVTDQVGKFNIDVKPSDSIFISSVGFRQRTVLARDVKDTLYLEEEARLLGEVTISTKRRTRKKDIGNLENKTILATGGANQYAKLFNNDYGSEGILQSITLSFQPEAKKYGRYMTAIMVRVYANNNGVPGSDRLFEKIIIPIKENQKQAVIDLLKYNIFFPKDGLFVGFDFIGFYDSSGNFAPYSKIKTPVNLRVEFAKDNVSDTFNRFFGTSWRKVNYSDRNGSKVPISAKFGITVIY